VSVTLRLGGAVGLLVLMFATAWYGVSTPAGGAFGAAGSGAVHVWEALTIVRWVLLAAVVSAASSLGLASRASADVALGVGLLATALLVYRLLIVLPEPHAVLDVKLGGYLALLACAALTLGAYQAEIGPRID
jgi:hypothetical protein